MFDVIYQILTESVQPAWFCRSSLRNNCIMLYRAIAMPHEMCYACLSQMSCPDARVEWQFRASPPSNLGCLPSVVPCREERASSIDVMLRSKRRSSIGAWPALSVPTCCVDRMSRVVPPVLVGVVLSIGGNIAWKHFRASDTRSGSETNLTQL